MSAPARLGATVVNLQVLELQHQPPTTLRGVVPATEGVPAHFVATIRWLYAATEGGQPPRHCEFCDTAPVGWEYQQEWQTPHPDDPTWRWHHTVLVTTDGGATVRTMCEECSGNIGPEVVFA